MTDALRVVAAGPDDSPLPGMIGRHPAMRAVYARVRRAAGARLHVLVVGETGAGKELVARALHTLGRGWSRPFVDVNCAAVPEHLAEAELFGWERGAFTGAIQATPGLLESADGGTLFLDEADSLPAGLQAKLLRAIELKEVRRVGGRTCRRANFRLVVAVAESVERLIERGRFRPDFAERVAGIAIAIPPLRERGNDLTLLARHFLAAASGDGRPPKRLTPGALTALASYDWPRNVRQLKTVMERIAVLCDRNEVTAGDVLAQLPVRITMATRESLEAALAEHGGNVSRAARTLGVARSTVYERLRRFGFDPKGARSDG